MPFRLTNVPTTFQHFMNNIFSDLLDTYIVVYLNNILIYSKDLKQHVKHVWYSKGSRRMVSSMNPAKCEWHTKTVEYLGFILSLNGLSMDTAKVKVIQNWPMLWKVKDIQSFLGFANFYHCFIHGYSNIVTLMTCLT